MNLNKPPSNIKNKPEDRLIVLGTPFPSGDIYRKWWEDVRKRLKNDPHYIPINCIPSIKELKEIELD
jgi:hypothetical protein